MTRKIINIMNVAEWRLCVGCGACYFGCAQNAIKLIDIENIGIRPIISPHKCIECCKCLQFCPGLTVGGHDFSQEYSSYDKRWGPFLEIWEGYASDPEIRMKGSSGGLCTALSLFCLEHGNAGGVLHTGTNPSLPYKNMTCYSIDREMLIDRMGSRYAPASPCEGFSILKSKSKPSVFIVRCNWSFSVITVVKQMSRNRPTHYRGQYTTHFQQSFK